MRNAYGSKVKVINPVGGQTATKQSFKDECDINSIMRKYRTTGVLPAVVKSNPQYGDFSDVPSFQAAIALVSKAEEQFNMLSAHVRKEFDYDPAKFLAFATDPANAERMVSMGLAVVRKNEGMPTPTAKGTKDAVGRNAQSKGAGKGPSAPHPEGDDQ